MPAQGSNHDGPLSVRGGGLRLSDPVRITNKSSEERFARLVITSAQLLAAVGGVTLFQLAPAPGGTKYHEFIYGTLLMKHGGTTYTGAGSIRIGAGLASDQQLSANVSLGLFGGAISDLMVNIPALSGNIINGAFINQPLSLAWASGAPPASLTGGNGSLIVQVNYRIVDSSLT